MPENPSNQTSQPTEQPDVIKESPPWESSLPRWRAVDRYRKPGETLPPSSQQTIVQLSTVIKKLWFPILLFPITILLIIVLDVKSKQFEQNQALLQTRLTPTPAQVQDPTANWKTYTADEYQLEFKYPQNWILDNTSSAIVISFNNLKIKISKLSTSPVTDVSLMDWYNSLDSQETEYDGASQILDRKQIEIGGLKGIQLTESFNTKTTVIYLARTSDILKISIEPSEYIKDPIVQDFLSTFKFLSEIQNWQVYTNTNHNFSVKYPDNFRVIIRKTKFDPEVSFQLDQSAGSPMRWLDIEVFEKSEADEKYKKYLSANIGESFIDDQYSKDPTYDTWKRLPNRTIAGITALEFSNDKPWELSIMNIILFSKNDKSYLITYIPFNSSQKYRENNPKDPEASIDFITIFNQILSTFQFLD